MKNLAIYLKIFTFQATQKIYISSSSVKYYIIIYSHITIKNVLELYLNSYAMAQSEYLGLDRQSQILLKLYFFYCLDYFSKK